MKQLALSLPEYNNIGENFGLKPELASANIGSIVSQLLDIAFIVAGFLMFIWAAWGVFQYIFSGGNKEGLAKARSRITWAIVGFIIIMLSFAISQYIQQLVPANSALPVTPVTSP
ncbi:MAG: pilin [Patescibacteria group bacterium]|nr:pilin [Patescibacteria group bacterium]